MTTRVACAGTFDIIHPGHLYYLEEAASMGDELLVCLLKDDHQLSKQIVKSEDTRKSVLEALEIVDRAIPYSDSRLDFPVFCHEYDIDIAVTGPDWEIEDIDGVEVRSLDDRKPYSSSEYRNDMRQG
ncbi:MAG: adenylyltransferase/cytidyltransferase family protein [Candidatus Nanohaloarchaea archaeon]|nr:adenylyltransferase/cytidyltransferase family protein [Candidatus Nanohaloarchaea archaeon]